MTERPIIFSGPMVRAILDGTKTQTRRVCKWGHDLRGGDSAWGVYPARASGWIAWFGVPRSDGAEFTKRVYEHGFPCPYGIPGDRLWVRETIRYLDDGFNDFRWVYSADGIELITPHEGALKYKSYPSIHMSRWASRITLEITGVRVERLLDISVLDCIHEGCSTETPYSDFAEVWDSINAKRGFGWNTNPWVWVVEFRRIS